MKIVAVATQLRDRKCEAFEIPRLKRGDQGKRLRSRGCKIDKDYYRKDKNYESSSMY